MENPIQAGDGQQSADKWLRIQDNQLPPLSGQVLVCRYQEGLAQSAKLSADKSRTSERFSS